MSGNVHNLEKTNSSQVGKCSTEIPSASSAAENHQQAMSLFTGAVIGNPRSWSKIFSKEVQKAKSTGFWLWLESITIIRFTKQSTFSNFIWLRLSTAIFKTEKFHRHLKTLFHFLQSLWITLMLIGIFAHSVFSNKIVRNLLCGEGKSGKSLWNGMWNGVRNGKLCEIGFTQGIN